MYCTLTLIVVIEMWSSSVLGPSLKPTCWFLSAFVRSTKCERGSGRVSVLATIAVHIHHHSKAWWVSQFSGCETCMIGSLSLAMFCFPFSEHISAVLFGLSTKIFFFLVFLYNSDWCCLQGHSGSFCFPQRWTLTTDNKPGGVRTNLRTLRDLSGPVREGVPKLGVSMLNAISHWGDAAFPKQLFVYRNPGGTMLLDF